MLDSLHLSHWGIVKVKQLARRYVWWSTINTDIETVTQKCDICRQSSTMPTQHYTAWPATEKPWERIHLDFAGPFRGKMWLLCIDAYSKFPYVGMMEIGQTSSKQTVQVIKDIFALEGLPDTIVTDNGAQFTSKEFDEFCLQHHIHHITSPAYHPPSNGEAERYVQTFKKSVDKNCVGGLPLKDSVRLTLATYRSLPHPAIGWKTPAELLHGRQPRNLLAILNPKNNAKHGHTSPTDMFKYKQFTVDSLVYARNYAPGPMWVPGRIISKVGTTMFMVNTDKGTWKRHANQLQIRFAINNTNKDSSSMPSSSLPRLVSHDQEPVRRYPLRVRRAPERYQSQFVWEE